MGSVLDLAVVVARCAGRGLPAVDRRGSNTAIRLTGCFIEEAGTLHGLGLEYWISTIIGYLACTFFIQHQTYRELLVSAIGQI